MVIMGMFFLVMETKASLSFYWYVLGSVGGTIQSYRNNAQNTLQKGMLKKFNGKN